MAQTIDAAARLAELADEIDRRQDAAELLALATEIDELGRKIALAIAEAHEPADVVSLRPVLLGVAPAYTRTLLRAAEKYDDTGSPRRATFALVEALQRAFDANMVDVVGAALGFVLEANEQAAGGARVRAIVTEAAEERVPRRDRRKRHVAAVGELRATIDWAALEDEPSTS